MSGKGWKTAYDVKPYTPVGRPTGSGTLFTPREPSIVKESGLQQISPIEGFKRVSESALELTHEGRLKDFDSSITEATAIFEAAGKPDDLKLALDRFIKAAQSLKENPVYMKESDASLYNANWPKKVAEVKNKLYRKMIPDTVRIKMERKDFQKIYDPTGMKWIEKTNLYYQPKKSADYLGKTFIAGGKKAGTMGRHFKGKEAPINIAKKTFTINDNIQYLKVKQSIHADLPSYVLYHEGMHQLHPRAPEWMIGGIKSDTLGTYLGPRFYKLLPGADTIKNEALFNWVQSKKSELMNLPKKGERVPYEFDTTRDLKLPANIDNEPYLPSSPSSLYDYYLNVPSSIMSSTISSRIPTSSITKPSSSTMKNTIPQPSTMKPSSSIIQPSTITIKPGITPSTIKPSTSITKTSTINIKPSTPSNILPSKTTPASSILRPIPQPTSSITTKKSPTKTPTPKTPFTPPSTKPFTPPTTTPILPPTRPSTTPPMSIPAILPSVIRPVKPGYAYAPVPSPNIYPAALGIPPGELGGGGNPLFAGSGFGGIYKYRGFNLKNPLKTVKIKPVQWR